LSKNLYNYCNYILRQEYFENQKLPKEEKVYISAYKLINKLTKENQIDYRALSPQTSQQVINLLFKNWQSFYKAIKIYKKDKTKFLGIPKLPKYKKKNGRNIIIFTNQQAFLKMGYIHFPKLAKISMIKTKVFNIDQVRVIPKVFGYIIEVVYKKEVKEHNLDNSLYLGIDLGIDNLATLVTSQGDSPILVNGKIIKSINQFYNKKKAKLMSYIGDKGNSKRLKILELRRECKINDYLHKVSNFIIQYAIENKIKNIVIGNNKGWKQEVNIGKVNNQKFVSIPYDKLIYMIEYKAEENIIKVIRNEEFYTSKCDALAVESLNKQEKYLGKRIKRGLFQSSIGKLINADVNGAINILRKVIQDDFIKNLLNRGLVYNPIRINILIKEGLISNG